MTNSKTAPYLSSIASWIKSICMAIIVITGTSMLYDRYYMAFRDLVAARGSFHLGITAPISFADLVTGIAGAIGAVAAGSISFGAGAVVVGGIVGGAMAKFIVPTLIHVFFLALCLFPALSAIAAQGLISTLPFSTTDTSAAPGSGLTGNLPDLISNVPDFAAPALGIVMAFIPLAFIAAYWVSYLATSRILFISTAYSMGAQAAVGKS